MSVIESLIFFGAIANYKNKTADTTLVKPPGGSFPNQRFIESFNHGVIFNHLFLSCISFHPSCDALDKDFSGLLSFRFCGFDSFSSAVFRFLTNLSVDFQFLK